jgi:hypothetical protein
VWDIPLENCCWALSISEYLSCYHVTAIYFVATNLFVDWLVVSRRAWQKYHRILLLRLTRPQQNSFTVVPILATECTNLRRISRRLFYKSIEKFYSMILYRSTESCDLGDDRFVLYSFRILFSLFYFLLARICDSEAGRIWSKIVISRILSMCWTLNWKTIETSMWFTFYVLLGDVN